MTTLPPTVRAALVAALRPITSHAGALPDPLPAGRVERLFDPASGGSETVRVLAGQDGDGYFLDYFRRDETSAWHGRIRPGLPDEDLENYEGQFDGAARSGGHCPRERARDRAQRASARGAALQGLRGLSR